MPNPMIMDELNKKFTEEKLIPDRSFPYCAGKSTSHCINALPHRIAILKRNGYKVVGMTTGIRNAYNCVKIRLIDDMLVKAEVDVTFRQWIVNFLSNRNLKLGKEEVKLIDGLPQGSCLSPILFNLYTRKFHDIEDSNTLVFQYAADFIIMKYDYDFGSARYRLVAKVTDFKELAKTLNLPFYAEKSSTIYFAKGGRKRINLVMDGVRVQQKAAIIFLGISVKYSLTTRDHYDKAIEKAKNKINSFKWLTAIRGGLELNMRE